VAGRSYAKLLVDAASDRVLGITAGRRRTEIVQSAVAMTCGVTNAIRPDHAGATRRRIQLLRAWRECSMRN
jgi:hypothetical protein